MTTNREETRYRINDSYGYNSRTSNLKLLEEVYTVTAKQAMRRTRWGRTRISIEQFNELGKTPEEALDLWRAAKTEIADQWRTRLDEAIADLSVATDATIVDGRLVMPEKLAIK